MKGNATMSRTRTPVRDRLLSRREIDGQTGCWNWTGYIHHTGYGQIRLPDGPQTIYTHRVSYETFVGPIPDGLQIDHLCRNRTCFNPEHLEPVTSKENTRRAPASVSTLNAAKTHCPSGHPYDDTNTYLCRQEGGVVRRCKVCTKAATQRHLDRKKALAEVSS